MLVVCLPTHGAERRDGTRRSLRPSTAASETASFRPAFALTRRTADHYEIESGPVDFGRMPPGEPREIPAAIRVRVFASHGWVLGIMPDSPLRLLGGGGASIPHSRMSWRTPATGTYSPFDGSRSEPVARGGATGPAGELVVIDLSLELDDEDEVGVYGCDFRFVLEPL